MVTVTGEAVGYRALLASLTAITLTANSVKSFKSRTPAKLYVYETLLEWLAQDLKDMAAELEPCIQEEHAMVGQRHVARHRHVVATDQSCIRDGMVGRAKRAGRDQRRTVAGTPRKYTVMHPHR
jgi:hypothetical protein